jgi:hypothetical protein
MHNRRFSFNLRMTFLFGPLAVMVLGLLAPAQAAARKEFYPCRPIGKQCVGVVVLSDGEFWHANRVIKDGKETWEPIKKADCPNINSYHPKNVYRYDYTYGDYICKYESANEAPQPAMRMGAFGRYISTHKMLLVTDSLLVLSGLADSASSVHCQHMHPACVESNEVLGKHPSNATLYGSKMGLTAGWIVLNHWWASDNHGEPVQRVYVFWTAPLIFLSATYAYHNADVAVRMSKARAQIMQAVPIR